MSTWGRPVPVAAIWRPPFAYYQQALRLQPQNFDAHRNLGSVLTKLHRFVDAVTHLWQAFYLNPTSADVRLHLGMALLKAGREDEAIPHFEFVLQGSPHDRRALAGLGQALIRNPQAVERALDCWQRLVAIEPDEPAMHNNLGDDPQERQTVCRGGSGLPAVAGTAARVFSGTLQSGSGPGRRRSF